MDMRVLHCPLCTLPFKPPVFQVPFFLCFFFDTPVDPFMETDVSIYRRTLGSVCVQCDKGGHQACGGCVALLPGGRCSEWTCGWFFVACSALDAIVSSTKVECPHDGCQLDVPYDEAADHRSACPHAPCDCTEPGSGFVGPPQELAGHLVVLHSVPLRTVEYGRPANGGRADMVLVDIQIRSSAAPGAVVAADEPTFLPVPPTYMVGAGGDAGAPMEVPLNIRIDKIPR
ncbi:E3 ubiquitin-protein ligase [Hordeum vulgare]|nr:E3 ubiquitin-protein ligase [Hordeum vulgare]